MRRAGVSLAECSGNARLRLTGRVAPDLVLQREVRTPLDIERTVGLSEGNIFAGEFLAPQMYFFRPAPGWSQYRTPISGYYQCGSGTHPGGCVMGAPGKLAAARILGDLARTKQEARREAVAVG